MCVKLPETHSQQTRPSPPAQAHTPSSRLEEVVLLGCLELQGGGAVLGNGAKEQAQLDYVPLALRERGLHLGR